MREYMLIYLKGFLMGICDLVPGISGGTIAFITGIYERLISAIRNITPKNYYEFFRSYFKDDKKKVKKILKKLDLAFLMLLFGGIFSAIFLGVNIISYLLENYLVYVLAFFIGLVLSSSIYIRKQINNHTRINYLFAVFGFIAGVSLLFLVPATIVNPTFTYIMLGGFSAIFALFLPGISGSFILLILGLYEFIINSVKNISENYSNLIPFSIGAVIGVFVISRVISYLFVKDRCKTLYFLFGLVLGTLIIPMIRIFENVEVFTATVVLKLIGLFLFGILTVYIIEKLSN